MHSFTKKTDPFSAEIGQKWPKLAQTTEIGQTWLKLAKPAKIGQKWQRLAKTLDFSEFCSAWVTQPERPTGAKDEVKRPKGPTARSRGPEGT